MKTHPAFPRTKQMLLALALGACTLPSWANDIVDGGEYYIISDYYNKVLGLDSEASTTPALSDYGKVSTENAYIFVAEKSTDESYFYLRNKATGQYLTASTKNGYSLTWKDAKGTGSEYLWKLDVQLGRSIVSKRNSGKMLGLDWSTDDFVHVFYNKSYNSTTRFTVVPVVEGTDAATSLAQAQTSVFENAIGRKEKDIYDVQGQMELSDDIDLHIMGTKPFTKGTEINITHPSAWIIFDNVTPSKVYSFLQYIKVNGAKAQNGKNVRIAIYLDGAAVIPFKKSTESVFTGYTEPGLQGEKLELTCKDFPSLNSDKQQFDNRMRSFVLKRGFMAVVASGEAGKGYSRVFVADHADLTIDQLPEALDRRISSIHIKPWQYTPKKGWCSTQSDANIAEQTAALNAPWFYTWSGDRTSTTNCEYVPIRQHYWWPSLSELKSKEASTHVLGFNEPDHAEQHENCSCGGTISPWDATVRTQEMSDLPMRIGSPAPTDLSWSKEYFGHVDDMGYRCDFSVIHAYWGPNEANGPQAWYNRLKDLYDATKRPIWITEWAYGASWTKEEWPTDYTAQLEKNRAALFDIVNMLESCPFVERYSYYQWDTSSRRFINDDGWMTPAGEMYKKTRSTFSFNQAYQPVPTWWRPENKPASISFTDDEAHRTVVLHIANPMTDYTESLSLEHYNSQTDTWEEVNRWTDRTAFDTDTLTYEVNRDDFDRSNDRYRVKTRTIFGADITGSAYDMGFILNPNCDNGTDHWEVTNLSTNKGEAADGNADNAYWNIWKGESFTSSMKQTVKALPAGKYSLSMLIRGSLNMEAEVRLTVRPLQGESRSVSASYTGKGNATVEGSEWKNGWERITLDKATVNEGDEVDIEVTAKSNGSGWWSADEFSLAYKSAAPSGIHEVPTHSLDTATPAYSIDGRHVNAEKAKGIIVSQGKKWLKK